MRLKKWVAFAAFVITIVALAFGMVTPANAWGWRHGFGPRFHPRPYAFRHSAYVYRHGPHPYRRYAAWGPGWHAGPGYAWHSWAWYNTHPAYWRAAHPYHGSPSVGIWVHI